jgi:hypothetical protein
MATLYGTTSNGETLPVQVNTFGQLVAQGLEGAKGEKGDKGDKGEQGEQGQQGPPGQDAGLVETRFDPILSLTNDGDYLSTGNNGKGFIYDFAGLTFISFSFVFNDFAITNPRGEPRVSGFPALRTSNWLDPRSYSGWVNRSSFFAVDEMIQINLEKNGFQFRFNRSVNNVGVNCLTTDIRETNGDDIMLTAAFFGVRATAEEAREQLKEAIAEGFNP